jgi:hypothetical protein
MLIHQIPPKPNYLRVKVGRRLARIGAVALKNTVYVLPKSDEAQENLQWVLREVTAAGGEAALLDAQLIDGLSDAEMETLFRDARDEDYAVIAQEARALEENLDAPMDDEQRKHAEAELARLERQVEEIAHIDFFGASGRVKLEGLMRVLRAKVAPPITSSGALATPHNPHGDYHEWTWVTRTGVHVDRIACSWLIRRFIDPLAKFKFVPPQDYAPLPGELRFDMFEGEFSPEGDMCTFEVLCARFELDVPGLSAVGELVHNIDLKDDRFARPETPGIAAQIAGLVLLHQDDETRLARGAELFDALLGYFAKKR